MARLPQWLQRPNLTLAQPAPLPQGRRGLPAHGRPAALARRSGLYMAADSAAAGVLLALFFNLDAIASIGSAVALLIFTLITAAHLRVREQTGASTPMLVAAIGAAGIVLVTFVFTTLIHEPASIVSLVAILGLSVALETRLERGPREQGQGGRTQV